jgi:two-component system, NtrC family, sensor kinase
MELTEVRLKPDLDRSERLARILAIVQEIGMADLDVASLMRLIVERTRELTGASGAAIAMPVAEHFRYVVAIGTAEGMEGLSFPRERSLAGVSLASGEVTRCDDALIDENVNREMAIAAGVRSVISVPLQHRGRTFGILEVAHKDEGAFGLADVEALRLMAGFLSASMAHAGDFQEIEALVAERTAAISALEESQRLFRSAFHGPAVAMALTNPRGKLLQVNSALCELLGHSECELLASPITTLLPRDVTSSDRTAIGELLTGKRDSLQQEVRLARTDGEVVWVLMTASLARDHSGARMQIVWQLPDITKRKRVEDDWQRVQVQLAQSQKLEAVGQLVSGVAHELNNPLSAILGFSEMLMADAAGSDREALTVIHGQAHRSRAIVRDLLSFVRQREGRQREPVDTGEMLRRLARTIAPSAQAEGVTLELVAGNGYPVMQADEPGLEQVITNLVMNAIQGAGRSGKVVISTVLDESSFAIMVEDNGPGIAADAFPRLFEPFFTTKAVGQGTGLGLPVSLGIVQQHGGTLTAVNRPAEEGGGARFTVSLPLQVPFVQDAPVAARAQYPDASAVAGEAARATALRRESGGGAAPRPPAEAATGTSTTAQRRVLVIDDEQPIRSVLRRFFEKRSWHVSEADDGASALVALLPDDSHDVFDLIICDLRMPGVSGIEMYQTVSTRRPELLDRLIFATGDIVSPESAGFLREISCPVLEKPYELALLDEVVSRVLGSGVPQGS